MILAVPFIKRLVWKKSGLVHFQRPQARGLSMKNVFLEPWMSIYFIKALFHKYFVAMKHRLICIFFYSIFKRLSSYLPVLAHCSSGLWTFPVFSSPSVARPLMFYNTDSRPAEDGALQSPADYLDGSPRAGSKRSIPLNHLTYINVIEIEVC